MNEIKRNDKEISKNGLIENAKYILKNKFGFISSHKHINSESTNNSAFLLSKSSINNSKDKLNKSKIKLCLLGTMQQQNQNHKKEKISQSCTSLINTNLKNKNQSRNYNQSNTNLISNIDNSKYNSSSFIYQIKILKTMENKPKHSYSNANLIKQSQKRTISIKQNKSFLNQTKKKYNEIIFNIKPIIKKKENILQNHLWSKLISNIDQNKNHKINKYKTKYINKFNILSIFLISIILYYRAFLGYQIGI